jgi:hypothetical protein
MVFNCDHNSGLLKNKISGIEYLAGNTLFAETTVFITLIIQPASWVLFQLVSSSEIFRILAISDLNSLGPRKLWHR